MTDYDSGEDWPATRVALRLTPKGRPEIGASTLDLACSGDGSRVARQPALDRRDLGGGRPGRGPGLSVTVPMELEARATPQPVKVSEAPGRPSTPSPWPPAAPCRATSTRAAPAPTPSTSPSSAPSGTSSLIDKARATMTTRSGAPEALTLIRLGPGALAANVGLEPGRVAFAIDAATGHTQRGGQFEQVID